MRNSILIFFILIFITGSCYSPGSGLYMKIAGFAQGTTYNMTYEYPDTTDLKPQVDSILRVFDMSFSLYQTRSLLSRINRHEEKQVNEQFMEVFMKSYQLWKESDGYFDVTVLPLVNAWGFGPGEKIDLDKEIVDSLMQFVGMNKLRLENNHLIKEHLNVQIDFNAIAQGYSVDVVAKHFDKLGINNYMIEIGGEIRTKGLNPGKQAWKIGVDRPDFGNIIPGQQLQVILRMRDKALATSGNYRKFYEEDGVKYTHSINPKTGYPSRNTLLSATVLADDCMTADAWATAFMVMGLEKSIGILDQKRELDAYLIYGDEIGRYQVHLSKGMRRYIFQEVQQM